MKSPKSVETLKHDKAKQKNSLTVEHRSVMREDEKSPVRVAGGRCLVAGGWRGQVSGFPPMPPRKRGGFMPHWGAAKPGAQREEIVTYPSAP
jgi:hypothetical protein